MSDEIRLRFGREDGVLVSRAEIVAEARKWIDTPFMHQQHMIGVGCDCGGLIRGVLMTKGLLRSDYLDFLPEEARGYAATPDGVSMRRSCDALMTQVPLGQLRPGDVVLLEFERGLPQHTAIVADYRHGGLSVIHALGPHFPSKVIEHRLDSSWRKRIVAAYAIPGVA